MNAKISFRYNSISKVKVENQKKDAVKRKSLSLFYRLQNVYERIRDWKTALAVICNSGRGNITTKNSLTTSFQPLIDEMNSRLVDLFRVVNYILNRVRRFPSNLILKLKLKIFTRNICIALIEADVWHFFAKSKCIW